MPHMIAGVTAPPRWQCSSARAILREMVAMALRIAQPGPLRPLTCGRTPADRQLGLPASASASAGQRDDPAVGVDRRLAAQPLQLGAGHLVAGVVARAHERPRFDVLEAERERLDLHLGELVGVVVALEREVLERRAQVLADREDVAVDRAQVARTPGCSSSRVSPRPTIRLDFVWTG